MFAKNNSVGASIRFPIEIKSMEDIEKHVEAIVNDLKSCDPFSEKVCEFISNCVLETLSNPLKVKDLNGFDFNKLLEIKRKIEVDIGANLKKTCNIDYDVGKAVSVFETASFFDEVLSSLTGIRELGDGENKEDNEIINETRRLSDNLTSDNKIYHNECSLKTGHVDLDVAAFRKSNLKNKMSVSSFKDNFDKNSFRPVIKPPLTKSKFKLINVNSFLSFALFCDCCKRRLTNLKKLYTLSDLNIKSQSSFVIHSESSLFKPIVKYVPDEGLSKIRIGSVFSTAHYNSASSSLELSENVSDKTNDVLDLSGGSPKSHDLNLPDSHQVCSENSLNILNEPDSPLVTCNKSCFVDKPADKVLTETVESVKNPNLERDKSDTLPNDNLVSGNTDQIMKNKTEIVTSKQILDEIYCKYNVKKDDKLIELKKPCKSLKEKLEVMSKQNSNQQNHSKIVTKEPLNRPVYDKSKHLVSLSEQKTVNRDRLIVISKNKLETSDVNPDQVLNGTSGYVTNVPSKTLVNDPMELIAPCSLKKTITNQDVELSNMIDEYIPLVVLDNGCGEESGVNAVRSKEELLLSAKRRKAIRKLAKLLKKEKCKKKKNSGKKMEIDLEPPPGVDIDDFLQQQLENIKLKLIACDNSKSLDKKDLPDLIKDQIDTDKLRIVPNLSISTVHNSISEFNRRKVISMTKSSNLLEDGEIPNHLSDDELSLKAKSMKHQRLEYNRKESCNLKSDNYRSNFSKGFASSECNESLVAHSPLLNTSLISISDDELLSSEDSVELVKDENTKPKRCRSPVRSPLNYRRHRSRSRSPLAKHCRKYSRSPRRRRSPLNRFNRSFRRRSRSVSPRCRSQRKPCRRRSRSRLPQIDSPRRQYGKSKSPSNKRCKYSKPAKSCIRESGRSSLELRSKRRETSSKESSRSDRCKKSDSPKCTNLKVYEDNVSSKTKDPICLNASPISDTDLNLLDSSVSEKSK